MRMAPFAMDELIKLEKSMSVDKLDLLYRAYGINSAQRYLFNAINRKSYIDKKCIGKNSIEIKEDHRWYLLEHIIKDPTQYYVWVAPRIKDKRKVEAYKLRRYVKEFISQGVSKDLPEIEKYW